MPPIEIYSRLADVILELEAELRAAGLWSLKPPSEEALSSQQPFCIDTLEFPEWLQFIFIVRIKQIIEQQHALPTTSEIVPMAEVFFSDHRQPADAIIAVLGRFDTLINHTGD